MKISTQWQRCTLAVLVAVGAAVMLAACGSSSSSPASSSSSGGSTSASGTSKVVSTAKAAIASYTKAPTAIAPTVPITKAIPKGKTIVYVNCGATACTTAGDALTAAAKYLGWNVKDIEAVPTPQGIQNAFAAAIRIHPAAVLSAGFGSTQYPEQLKQLNALKIPVLSETGTDNTGQNGITLQILPVSATEKAGRILANQAIVTSGGSGTIGVVQLSGYPSQTFLANAFTSEIKSKCPACTTKTLPVTPSDIGTTAASKISSWLVANPTIKQVFFTYDALAVGLPAAVKGTGGAYPDTYSWAPDQTGVEALQIGQRTASIPLCYNEVGYQWADALARIFTGMPITPDEGFQHFVIWGKQYNNVPTSTADPACDANYQKQFEALWK